MDILIISKFIVVIALIIVMLAALRASAYKSTSMGLLASSIVINAFAIVLFIGGDFYNLGFYKDISLALIFFGFVGTIAFAAVLGGDDND
jgi:energy-converting hydrogenase B subunit B